MSDGVRPDWVRMKREDFEAGPSPKPTPPGQMELFEPGPTKAKVKPRGIEPDPVGMMDLLEALDVDG
ncbi:hypothetical protein ACFU76_00565 [Streptomyces sp. NPDC057539]|uniref:hypothetical protein n=1 Tax=Streptomyces sp. NPDC057539 TaxID=3346159 RepID=UPI003678FB61